MKFPVHINSQRTVESSGCKNSRFEDLCLLVITILIFALIATAIGASALRFLKAGNLESHSEQIEITVQPGDSFWSLAETYAPDYVGIRTYIDKVQQLNHTTSLYPGMKISLYTDRGF